MSPPRRRNANRPPRRRAASARAFWGSAEAMTDAPPTPLRPSDHPTALVRSLGPVPLPGGDIAQHYFEAINERAAGLAIALAAAVGLLADDEDDHGDVTDDG